VQLLNISGQARTVFLEVEGRALHQICLQSLIALPALNVGCQGLPLKSQAAKYSRYVIVGLYLTTITSFACAKACRGRRMLQLKCKDINVWLYIHHHALPCLCLCQGMLLKTHAAIKL